MRISDFGFSFDRSGAVCYQVELRRDEIRNPQSAFRNHALVLSFGVTSSTIRFY